MKKKIFACVMSAIMCFSLFACNTDNGKNSIVSKVYTPDGVYYQGDELMIYDVSYYFEDVSQNTVYTTDVGNIDKDGRLIVPLPEPGDVAVKVTATEGKRSGKLEFTVNVLPDVTYENIFNSFNDTEGKLYANRAVELNTLVEDKYWNAKALMAQHYYPNLDDPNGDNSAAFAWPYTEMVAANWRIASLSNVSKRLERYYRGGLEGYKYYLAARPDGETCYVATRGVKPGNAGGDTYYDDNVWVAREFLNGFEVLKDQKYFDTSVAVCEWIWTGWCEPLGGLYWCEQKKFSRNACSNAPAAILFARLYEYTKEQKWLDRAIACYDWTYNTLRDPVDNCYWDNQGVKIVDGELITDTIWKAKFTYNTGSMISAGVKLYEVTKDAKYLEHAKASAAGSYGLYFEERADRDFTSIKRGNESPWFNVLLLDGYIELYHHDKTVLKNIQAYEASLNYGYDHYRSPDGFVSNNWVDGFPKKDGNFNYYKLNILDMAGNSENYGQLANFYENVYEKE